VRFIFRAFGAVDGVTYTAYLDNVVLTQLSAPCGSKSCEDLQAFVFDELCADLKGDPATSLEEMLAMMDDKIAQFLLTNTLCDPVEVCRALILQAMGVAP
jgi:hypothetical protein